MKKPMFLVLFMALAIVPLRSQVCELTDRFLQDLPVSSLYGYYPGLQMIVPGSTISEKADSCLAQLTKQFPTAFNLINVKFSKLNTTSWFSTVEYRQNIDGIWMEHRGLGFQFDNNGHLISINLYLEFNSDTLTQLANLASGGSAETHTIQFVNGTYILIDTPVPPTQFIPPGEGLTDATIRISSAPYVNTCLDITTSVTIGINDSPLRTAGNDELFGIYANPSSEAILNFAQLPSLGCNDGSNCTSAQRHELIMCYYYLNHTFDYMIDKLDLEGSEMTVPVDVRFNAFLTPVIPNQPYPGAQITSQGHQIDFGASCGETAFIDIAEDADYIVAAAFASYIIKNTSNLPNGNNEGVGLGIANFWTWQYLNKGLDENESEHTMLGGWAGADPRSIDIISGTLDEETGIVSNKKTYDDVLSATHFRGKISVWAATLRDIFVEAFDRDEEKMDALLIATLKSYMDNNVNQPLAVSMLHHTALSMPEIISENEMRKIECILMERYPNEENVWPDGLTYFLTPNLYIKDTRLDQAPGFLTGEDTGLEPNLNSLVYDKSPSIWNCHSADCNQHERPNIGVTNYIRVLVSNRGCDWTEITGMLEVYAAFTTWNEQWPEDWGGDVNGDGTPDNAYYYWSGNSILVGTRIGRVSLGTYEEDPEGNGRIYTIPWTPWNPWGANKPFTPQLNYLARIVSTGDVIVYNDHGPAVNYVRENNNVARRKLSISLIAAPGPTPIPTPVKASAMLGTTIDFTDDIFIKFKYINPLFEYTADNFDSIGQVHLIFPQNLLATFGTSLPNGKDCDWVNDSTLLITGPDFTMPVNIEADTIYPLQIRYTPIGTFQPVSFRLNFADRNDCYFGGEYFDINTAGVSPRSYLPKLNSANIVSGFPNPAFNQYSIDILPPFEADQVYLYNSMGQFVFTPYDLNSRSISVDGLSNGIYIVQVILNNGQSHTLKFIKSN